MTAFTNQALGKIMFIDNVHPILWERLMKLGFQCVDFTTENEKKILAQISDFQGVVIRSKFTIDQKFIDKASNLQFIARSGSGLENIDLSYAKEKNVICFNSPEGNCDAVAEHCMGMILTLFNKISAANTDVKNGIWQREKNRGIELKGKTIGLIGYGHMAEAFAIRLSAFEVSIIAYDNQKTGFSSDIVSEKSLKELQDEADVVSLHVNYMEDNHYLVNKSFIQSFKKQFFLMNTSRGKCVDTRALIDGLKTKKVLGACLDVLEMENSAFQKGSSFEHEQLLKELSSFEQVILTPHVAGWTAESYFKLSKVLADKIQAHYQL